MQGNHTSRPSSPSLETSILSRVSIQKHLGDSLLRKFHWVVCCIVRLWLQKHSSESLKGVPAFVQQSFLSSFCRPLQIHFIIIKIKLRFVLLFCPIGFELDTSTSGTAPGVQGSASTSSFLSGGSVTSFQLPGLSTSSRTLSANNYSRSVWNCDFLYYLNLYDQSCSVINISYNWKCFKQHDTFDLKKSVSTVSTVIVVTTTTKNTELNMKKSIKQNLLLMRKLWQENCKQSSKFKFKTVETCWNVVCVGLLIPMGMNKFFYLELVH